nr:hypothetical protein Itr_chr10CG13520 [Ipomoea trifida]
MIVTASGTPTSTTVGSIIAQSQRSQIGELPPTALLPSAGEASSVVAHRVEELLCVANPRALSIERRQGEATGFVNPDLRICRVVLRQRRCCCRGHDRVSTSGGRPPAWLGVMSGVGGRRREAEGEMSTTCDGDDIWRRVVVLSADGSPERMAPKVWWTMDGSATVMVVLQTADSGRRFISPSSRLFLSCFSFKTFCLLQMILASRLWRT